MENAENDAKAAWGPFTVGKASQEISFRSSCTGQNEVSTYELVTNVIPVELLVDRHELGLGSLFN